MSCRKHNYKGNHSCKICAQQRADKTFNLILAAVAFIALIKLLQ